MVQGHASICKVLNTVYERKSGALRRIKTEDEKEAEKKDALIAIPMNKMANVVVTTGAMEGIFSPETFSKNHVMGDQETGGKGVVTAGAATAGVGVGNGTNGPSPTGGKAFPSAFHRMVPSEKTPLSFIPEDENATVPLVNNNSNNDNTNTLG